MTQKTNIWGFLSRLVLVCSLLACASETVKQPSLTDEKIARIMADLSIAEAATNGLVGFAKDSLLHVYIRQVFDIQGVTPEKYEEDLRILAHDLARMEAIVLRADSMLIQDAPEKK